MKKLDDVEKFIIDNYEDIEHLQTKISDIENKITSVREGEIINALNKRGWWTEEFNIKTDRREIHVFKKDWKTGSGEWDFVCIGIWGVELSLLIGEDKDWPPSAYVWSEQLKAKKVKFNESFKNYCKEIINSMRIINAPSENYPLYYNLSQTSQEWKNIIKTGRLAEELTKHFDSLAQFIEPIDKALAQIRKTKK